MKLSVLMSLGLMAFAWVCASPDVAEENPIAPVDKKIVRKVDVTGDGKPDTITLRVMGKDSYSPFTWTLTISSLGETVLFHTRNDKNIDGFFGDQDYVGNCKGYQECKSKWYYKDLLSILIVPKSGYELKGIMPEIDVVAGKYLADGLGIKGERAKAIITNIKNRLQKGHAIVISIPDTPATGNPIMVFAPEVRRFVEIY